jgi:hypothetical protein
MVNVKHQDLPFIFYKFIRYSKECGFPEEKEHLVYIQDTELQLPTFFMDTKRAFC